MNKKFIDDIVYDLYTIYDMLRWAVSYFSSKNIWYGHGTDNSWDEAIHLILPTLSLPLDIPKHICHARLTTKERYLIVERILRRVEEHIPVAYLTNKAWFCSYEFYIDKRALIPRSLIGELIINKFSGLLNKSPCRILDMCTGSGCIAIACAYAFPESKVDAVDISLDALIVAQKNIKKHNMINHVSLICTDLFKGLFQVKYDLIVTNPPYVSIKEMEMLPNEYYHEPKLGLIAGSDGLKIIRRILSFAADYLNDNGILICEVGDSMVQIIHQYPDVPFIWLDFNNGGEGVFMLTREKIIASQNHFSSCKN